MVNGRAALFVGREKERAQLTAFITGGHFAMVCGPGGIGKTALVQVALSDVEARFHRCRKGDTLEELGRGLLQAIGEGGAPALGDEELAAYVLERAENAELTVVIDDLHNLSEDSAERWCELVSRFAFVSRWIFTSRRPVALAEIEARTIHLEPLSDSEAMELAQRCGMRDAPEHTGGVPFWIKQLAAAQNAGASTDATAFLDGLSPESLRQLAMLSLMRDPVIERGSELAEHGLATESEGLARLHDAASDAMRASMSPDEEHSAARDAVSALAESERPSSQLDALRISLEHQDITRAKELLSGYQSWVHAGLGPRLWSLFAEEHGALSVEKMRIAVDVGSRSSLDWLAEQPAPAEYNARLDWAEGLLRSGRARRALEVLRAELLRAETREDSTSRTTLLLGEALCEAGEAAESVRVLRSIVADGEEQALRRDSKLAKALYHADQGDEAKLLLHSLEQRAVRFGCETLKAELSAERSALRLQLGLKDDRRVETTPSLGSLGRVFQGIRLAASGRYGHSAEIIAALRRIDVPASTSVLAGVVQGILRVTRGRYKGLSQTAREMVREAERLGNAPLYHWSFMLERVANLGNAAEHPELDWAPNIPSPTGVPQRYIQSLRVSHRARRGERIAMEELPKAAPGDGPLVHCICDLTEANVRLLSGDADRALLIAAAVTQRTARLGYFFFEGEALLIQCYAQLKLGRWSGLSHALDSLEALSTSLRSKRYGSIARLLRLSFLDRPDCSRLLSLVQQRDVSPTVARVAQTLMGGEASGDALDELLVTSLRARWTHDIEAMSGTLPPGAAWGFDAEAKLISLPDRQVSVSPLALRLLNCLFDEPQGASLSRVAEVVWGIDDYHQLRDSKRVHVAVRRLRTILEEEPSSPTRLLTVDEGYALSALDAPVRLVARS
ncbi:MAG: AAA family ATPase [Polyangiales bacterium]